MHLGNDGVMCRNGENVELGDFDFVLQGASVFHNNIFFSYYCLLRYCGWLNFHGVPIFIVFAKGPIQEFQCPWNSNFLYELWRKILLPHILNPTNMSFLFNARKLVPTNIKPSTVHLYGFWLGETWQEECTLGTCIKFVYWAKWSQGWDKVGPTGYPCFRVLLKTTTWIDNKLYLSDLKITCNSVITYLVYEENGILECKLLQYAWDHVCFRNTSYKAHLVYFCWKICLWYMKNKA